LTVRGFVGIQGEDSGTFGCTKVSSGKESNQEAFVHVQVLGNELSVELLQLWNCAPFNHGI